MNEPMVAAIVLFGVALFLACLFVWCMWAIGHPPRRRSITWEPTDWRVYGTGIIRTTGVRVLVLDVVERPGYSCARVLTSNGLLRWVACCVIEFDTGGAPVENCPNVAGPPR